MLIYNENTLPDFMESAAVKIYRQVMKYLGKLETDDDCIAEIVNVAVDKAVSVLKNGDIFQFPTT